MDEKCRCDTKTCPVFINATYVAFSAVSSKNNNKKVVAKNMPKQTWVWLQAVQLYERSWDTFRSSGTCWK
jgi:hypothetical protein